MFVSPVWGKSMIPALKNSALRNSVGAILLALAAGAALAQTYPNHTIKLVVPYGPGSSPDSVGRIVAQEMQPALGQPVIVANIAGALANVGTAEVARSAPDGYTILLTTNTPHAANVALVTSPQRTPLAPELPAIAETFPGFETRIWYGLVAPANTPKPVITKVHDVVAASLAKPEVRSKLGNLGLEPAPMPPDEFAAFIKQE